MDSLVERLVVRIVPINRSTKQKLGGTTAVPLKHSLSYSLPARMLYAGKLDSTERKSA